MKTMSSAVSRPANSPGSIRTLSAILRELASDELKIVSIEDPVEYRLAGGIEVSGLTYALYEDLSPGWGFV